MPKTKKSKTKMKHKSKTKSNLGSRYNLIVRTLKNGRIVAKLQKV